MNSDFAKRMDKAGVLFDSTGIADALNEIEEQYGASAYGKQKFSHQELYWIGYIYRYWAYISGESSKHLYKTIKPEQLRKVYYPYHSLDPLQAIERLKESETYEEPAQDDISRAVAIMRRIRNKDMSSKNKV